MTAAQFRAALDRLHLSQMGAARVLGLDGRTIRRYASGAAQIPKPTETLILLAVAGFVTVNDFVTVRQSCTSD